MPRLTRKNIKVFAGSATNNGVFGSLQANNPTTTSDVEQLQSLSAWSEGWNAATETSEELPPLEEIQGVEYVTTYQQAYIMQEGLPEWAATVTYYKGCLTKEVTSTGFKIYNSLTDNNTGNLLSDTSNWKKVMDSDDVYAFDNTVVHKTGNETITGTKTFQSQTLNQSTTSTSAGNHIDFVQEINKARRGTLRTMYNSDGSYSVMLGNNGTDASSPAGITVTRDATKTWAEAPSTPDIGDNSRKLATTAFVATAVNNLLSSLYPVGSIYIGTQNTCPLANLISGSQWQLVAQDRALWGGNGSNGNTTIAAGLPNITGKINIGGTEVGTYNSNGVLYQDGNYKSSNANAGNYSTVNRDIPTLAFDASRSSSIYGNSNTVQPPAYRVNVWRRTA